MPPKKRTRRAPTKPATKRATKPAKRQRSQLPIGFFGATLRPLKTSETVARDIVHDIVDNRLQAGDALPSESAMLDQYGVSRESLREGLRLLEVQGLIRIRRGPGGGPIVGYIDPTNLGRVSTLFFHLAGATYRELIDAWAFNDGILAELAARNADRELVRKSMAPYVNGGDAHHLRGEALEVFVDTHSEFHTVVAQLANNKVLQIAYPSIGAIAAHHVISNADPRDASTTLELGHERVARAISAGHARKARDLMEAHIREVATFYGDILDDRLDEYVDWR